MSALWGLLGLLTSVIPISILRYLSADHPSLFVPTVFVMTLIYMLICHFTDYRRDTKTDNQLINQVMEEDINSSLMEPLVYTFKQRSFKFKGSKFAMLDDVTNQVRSISGESVLHYIVWTMMVLLLVAEMVLFNPRLMNYKIFELNRINLSPNNVIEQIHKDAE